VKRSLTLIAIDQALLSGSSFLIAASFVAFGQKTAYSWYTLATTCLLLFSSLQNATVSTPLLTLGPRLTQVKRAQLTRLLWSFQFGCSLGLGLLGGAGLLWWSWRLGTPLVPLSLCLFIAVTGAWAREMRRSVALLDGNAKAVLTGDAVMVALLLAGFAGGWFLTREPRAEHALLAGGVAGLVTSLGRRGADPAPGSPPSDRDLIRDIVAQARWTVPSVVVSWIQSNVYPFVVSGLVSVVAVADLAATRLTIMPAMLITAAWSRYRLPHMGSLLASGGPDAARREALRLARLLVPVAFLNCILIASLHLSGLSQLLPKHYRGAADLLTWWGAYVVVSTVRTSLSTCAQARTDFRELFGFGVIAALVSIGGVALLLPRIGPSGAPIALTISEVVLGVALWLHLGVVRAGSPVSSLEGTASLERRAESR
jgi:O-antigen/teichoic acid export membrane protein